MVKVAKVNTFTHDVIFIDGTWGTGKSVIGPIISGMRDVEKQRFDPLFEYLCELNHLGKLEFDSAVAMVRMYADTDQYHNLLGREVNLRWSDDTGIRNNPGSLRYLRRLFVPGGNELVDRINRENLGLSIMSHFILPVARPLVAAFGPRLKVVEMVRHPVYLLTHWQSYFARFNGAREFTLSLDCSGQKVPWFAADWCDEFLRLSVTDRILASVVRLYEQMFQVIDDTSDDRPLPLVISFEHIAFDPWPVLDQLSAFLGREHHPRIGRILKSQKLPRPRITQGKGHAAYGWQARRVVSEKEEYVSLLDSVGASGSKKYMEPFMSLIGEYNRRWPSRLCKYQ